MQAKDQLIGLPVYQPGKPIEEVKKEYNLTDVIKLASNENPFGSSQAVQAAIVEECSNLAIYPDGAATNVRQALAEHYGLSIEQIIMGNGSDEIVQQITRTYLEPGTNSVMASPSFSMYKINVVIEGAEAREVPLADGVHDLEAMLAQIDNETRVVWVCNPNNPSGTYVNQTELESFLDRVPKHVLVVLDEAYYEYVVAEDYPESVPLLTRYPNLIILRTFSKIYGLAALRVGYGLSSTEIVNKLNHVREPFNTSRVAQAAAIAALKDQAFVKECKQKNREGLEQFYAAFDRLGLFYYPSQANFILVDLNMPGNQVFEHLLRQGIIVRSGEALGFPTFIRITVGTAEQNQKVIDALTKLVQERA